MPIPAAPIGQVTVVNSGGVNWQLILRGTHRVGAALQLETITEHTVPEPAVTVLLWSGILGLLALKRMRGER